MSLKGADLPDYVLATLYGNCLVTGPTTDGVASPKPAGEKTQATAAINFATQPTANPTATIEYPASTVEAASAAPYKYLGKNIRRISIVAGYEGDPYMPEDHLEFLTKILSACKLNLGDVSILNYHASGININKLSSELKPLQVLLFGIDPINIGLPLSFPMFKPQMFNGTNFLFIPPIVELNQDSAAAISQKKQLWECLKKMFLS
jgi:hypothetical protein